MYLFLYMELLHCCYQVLSNQIAGVLSNRRIELKKILLEFPLHICHRRDDEPLDLKRLKLLSRMLLRRRGKGRDPKSRHS
jgi:hypothetical protein